MLLNLDCGQESILLETAGRFRKQKDKPGETTALEKARIARPVAHASITRLLIARLLEAKLAGRIWRARLASICHLGDWLASLLGGSHVKQVRQIHLLCC